MRQNQIVKYWAVLYESIVTWFSAIIISLFYNDLIATEYKIFVSELAALVHLKTVDLIIQSRRKARTDF